jgi:hypothetical protein
MPIVVTDNKLCYSVYQPEHKILFSSFNGVVTLPENRKLFQEHLERGTEFSKNHEIIGVLVDFRKLHGSYMKYFNYLENKGYLALKDNGFSYEAFVISDDLIIKNITHKLVELLNRLGIKAKIFTDIKEAENWLLRKVNT